MVYYMLKITAELENLTNLQPQNGCNDDSFGYLFKVKCGNCGEVSQKETYVTLGEIVPIPKSRGTAHLVQKCKFCEREGTIVMLPGRGRPLTQLDSESGKFGPLMLLECRGYEPVDFAFSGLWKAESTVGTVFDSIDLSEGEFSEYDEKGEYAVMISNLRATFEVSKEIVRPFQR